MTRIVKRFPHGVREIENIWIPMPDGTRLAARVWLPDDADTRPVPAVLEFIPYRKRDFTAAGDALHHPYMAGNGYAAVRCDLRGNGDSEGLFDDEYSAQELDDGYHVVEWLAKQSWCTGRVGMMGISWGGFNCLQVAALRPPALKAVYSVCSTDDRYADDVHYMGGCLLNDNLMWGSTMTTFAMRPPDPEIVGSRWRDMWLERLEALPNLVALWMTHQTRDDYWKHGSVCENYADIEAAVYAVGGWADGYTNAVPRLINNLKSPCRGLIGPWAHSYPWKAKPGPRVNGLRDLVRWWDHWLKEEDTGMMDEPRIRAWLQDSIAPATSYESRPGRWVGADLWPSDSTEHLTFHLNKPTSLDRKAKAASEIEFSSELVTGVTHGDWCPYGYEAELPSDQREEDGRSLTFETKPLGRGFDLLGAPSLKLTIASDRAFGLLYARLCDVAPNGASTRVSYGVLNLTHRESHDEPQPLEPGHFYDVKLKLNDIAHRFPKGNRIRIGLSTSAWPLVWPSPERTTLKLRTGASLLRLPHLDKAKRKTPPSLGNSETASPAPMTQWKQPHRSRQHSRDFSTGESRIEMVKDRGHFRLDDVNLEMSGGGKERYAIGEEPLSARAEADYEISIRRDDSFDTRVQTKFVLTATTSDFLLSTNADAYEGSNRIFSKRWSHKFPRNKV